MSDLKKLDLKLNLSSKLQRVVNTSENMIINPEIESIDFLHSILCQVSMPRKQVKERIFERVNGNAIIRLESGSLFNGEKFIDMPLPYGTKPRLIMMYISSQAIKNRSRTIEIGRSIREFLLTLGINTNGGPRGGYTTFKKQMESLAACRMMLGIAFSDRNITINTQPITRFEAWSKNNEHPKTWPGVLELSQEFYETLHNHAVPLDHRAIAAIKHSALALDVYTWLAHRLCRINKKNGVKVSWQNLKEQFGQEYANIKDFKKEFNTALIQARSVYHKAKIEKISGGFCLQSSPSPISKPQVFIKKPLKF